MNQPTQIYLDAFRNNDPVVLKDFQQLVLEKIKWMLRNVGVSADRLDDFRMELFQEAFFVVKRKIALGKNIPQFDQPFMAYFIGISRNLQYERYRKNSRYKSTDFGYSVTDFNENYNNNLTNLLRVENDIEENLSWQLFQNRVAERITALGLRTEHLTERDYQRAMRLQKHIDVLKPKWREVLRLYWLTGCSMAEIAAQLDISVQNAKVIKCRAEQRLREKLAS